jgi:transposase
LSRGECTALLGEWEGYSIGTAHRVETAAGTTEVWIELSPRAGRMCCSGCGQEVASTHEVTERWVRDLPILDAPTRLLVQRRRVACPRCGPKLEKVDWLERYARVTRRLAESVARLCRVLPIRHVADFFDLGWDTVKAIDKAFLQRSLGAPDYSGVEVIAMDEFALRKGQRYATVVVDARSRRVLWVGRGRAREDIRAFFQQLGAEGCQRLRAVVMDMNAAYELEVRQHCPQAAIVYDLFHVVAKYGREVVDRVRVDQANKVRADRRARAAIKSSRWLLLRNADNLKAEQKQTLKQLLALNRPIWVVYLLKDDLKRLWTYRRTSYAMRFWKAWYRRAVSSRIPPLLSFAKRLKHYLPGILAHCRWPLHTSFLEGINNKIKVIKRMAYGFRNDDYFFLKIRAAFPGIPG